MKLTFINVKFNGEIKLSNETLNYLRNHKKVGLFTTTQFNHKIQEVIDQLKENGNEIISSQPERTNAKFQILGCDMYHGNLKLPKEPDIFLYVGDGRFHPNALIYHEIDSEKFREIVMFDPTNKKMTILTKKDVELVLKKREANKKKFLMADEVGVIVTTKPGQEHMHYLKKLRKSFPEKKFYAFIGDQIDFNEFENFHWITSWINTACPRIGMEDAVNMNVSLLNVVEALKLSK
jgi:diphthamide biosynthesis enzyme Dph1/Dph2-like protein